MAIFEVLIMPASILLFFTLMASSSAIALSDAANTLDLTWHWVGYAAIAIFVLAYVLVILEEKIHLRKSKPVLLAAG
ncbi:MAG: lipid-A-disaccharide synthase-like uncharacterized protein [Bacteroidia bacterium]|jgi:lipid-A-disaccharide synthase-like uncharacterized protein